MYRSPSRFLMLTVALVVAVLTVSACSDEESSSAAADVSSVQRAFLVAMVPHHESAVAMSQVAANRSQTPEIVDLAERIIAEQGPEIVQMRDIHRRLFGEELVADETAHEALDLSAEEAGFGHGDVAARLRAAPDVDAAFIDEMLGHHMGAIAMAEALLENGDDAETRALAQSIITNQQAEIDLMETLAEGATAPGVGGGDGDNPAAEPEHGAGHEE